MKIIIDDKDIEIKKANTLFKRFKGLMGKKNITYGMMFKKCNSIHTFFMKENIDVIGLDNTNTIIYKCVNLEKNKVLGINNPKKNTSILELPQNTSKHLKIGDKLTFIGK